MAVADSHPMAELVRRWTDAWNACDADGIVALAQPDFRMHRMKGDVIDREGLRDAVRRQSYGVAMKILPLRLYGREDSWAVASRIEFRHVEDDELLGSTDDGGMAVGLRDGAVVFAAPKQTCGEALEEARLTEADFVLAWE